MGRSLSESHKESIRKGMLKHWDGKRTPILQKNGYLTIRINGKPQYLHRVIMEEHIGRKLMPGEVVHHKNGDKTDNRIDNLEVLTIEDHARSHAKERNFGLDRAGISPSNKTPTETIIEIKRMSAEGHSIREISKTVGISYPTAWKYAKEETI